jgi:hypothetical protein
MYKPPASSIPTFFAELNELLSEIDNLFPNVDFFLAGDFNINFFSPQFTEFSNLLLTLNFYPTIFCPTHHTDNTESIIDNIFTNYSHSWLSGVLNCALSDHNMIFICVDKVLDSHISVDISSYSVSPTKLYRSVAACKWDFVSDTSCVHDDCLKLVTEIAQCISRSLVYHKKSANSNPSWITPAIRNSCNHKYFTRNIAMVKFLFLNIKLIVTSLLLSFGYEKNSFITTCVTRTNLMLKKFGGILIL